MSYDEVMLKFIKIIIALAFLPVLGGIRDELRGLKYAFERNKVNIIWLEQVLQRDVYNIKRHDLLERFEELKEEKKEILAIGAKLSALANTSKQGNKANNISEVIMTFNKPKLRQYLANEIASYI